MVYARLLAVTALSVLTTVARSWFPEAPVRAGAEATDLPSTVASSKPSGWQLPCAGDLCTQHPAALTLDELCHEVSHGRACSALGTLPSPVPGAVRRVALIELGGPGGDGLLALQVGRHWVAARPVGRGQFALSAVAPADVPGLSAPSVRIAVANDDATTHREETIICGVDGAGTPNCPVAVLTAREPRATAAASIGAYAASLASLRDAPFRVELELTAQGYVARGQSGHVPTGLAGEHRWME